MLILLVITASDIRNKPSFKRIGLKVLEYAAEEMVAVKRLMQTTSDEEEAEVPDSDDKEDVEELDSDNEEGSSSDTEGDEDDIDIELLPQPKNLIPDYKMGLQEFTLLSEKLPNQLQDFVLKLELFDGYMAIRTVPGDVHGRAAGVFNQIIFLYSQNPNDMSLNGSALDSSTDACMFLSVLP
jgi:hypothetical protein